MPSVASESHSVLPPRSHSPSPRSHSEPDGREPATPFNELLDSAPKSEPPPPRRQARSERAERDEPSKPPQSKPVQDRGRDTDAVNDSAGAKDSKAADGGDNTKDTKVTKPADGSGSASDGTTAASADAAKSDADQKAASDAALLALATPAVTAPQPIAAAIQQPLALAAATEGGTPETDALAALQAGGTAPGKTAKPGEAQGDKPAGAEAKSANSADAKSGAPEIDAGKDSQARGNSGKTAGDFNRAAADILAKPEISAATQPGGDAAAGKAQADAVQNLGVAAPVNAAQPAGAANAPAQLPAQAIAVPLSGLAVEITAHAAAGNKHFEIRLDPPELGRIDVKLDVDRDGNVSTRLVVDRADTLDLLKRDASSLERALQQSGLKTSDNALEFSLRQQAFAQDNTPQNGTHLVVPDDDPTPLEAMRQGYGRLLGLGRGLDIRV